MSGAPREDGSVDWAVVRARLLALDAAARAALEPSPEAEAATLAARARALAVPPPAPEGDAIELVTFALGDEVCALERRRVLEVRRPGALAPLPGVPALVLGVVEHRGAVLPVFDLAPLLGLGPGAAGPAARLLVIGREGPELALRVDAARDLLRVPVAGLLARPAGGGLVRAVTRDGVLVVDADRVLDDPRLFVDGRDDRSE